jgi:hypothetical protein
VAPAPESPSEAAPEPVRNSADEETVDRLAVLVSRLAEAKRADPMALLRELTARPGKKGLTDLAQFYTFQGTDEARHQDAMALCEIAIELAEGQLAELTKKTEEN